MNTLYFTLTVLLLNGIFIQAQQMCGIYRTVNDYRTQQVSIPVDCKFGKKAVQISDFFLRPYVYIRTGQGKIKIHEDSIYAVRDYEGNAYRIYKQRAYQLLDTGSLQIYGYTNMGTVKVVTSRSVRFENKQMTDYYFSVDDTSEIVPLTLINVRLALLSNKVLDKKLKTGFSNDASLTVKDGEHFEINRLISDFATNPK